MDQAASWQAATKLDLIPTPQHIACSEDRHSLQGWKLLAAEGLPAKGADVINRRIEELGGSALPTTRTLGDSSVILVLPWDHQTAQPFLKAMDRSPETLGEQGYIIRFLTNRQRLVVLALGADELGALYAAESLTRLIQPAAGGAYPELLEASVTDWPDFKRRCIGLIGSGGGSVTWADRDDPVEGYLEEVRPQIEWLARHKINYTLVGGGPADAVRRESARLEVARLAAEYGIRVRQTFGTSINDTLKPGEWTECVTRGSSKYCWSALEEHRERASRLARSAARTRLGVFCLHVIDAGGLIDPECWSERCHRCRATYGDDYVKASTDLFLTYYTALKEAAPECEFEAVVYPYHYQWAVPDFAAPMNGFNTVQVPSEGFLAGLTSQDRRRLVQERLSQVHQELAKRLPDDILITFREAGRDEFEAASRIWGDHPITPWVYFSRNQGWQGLWESQHRYIRSWYRAHPRDLLFHAGLGYSGNLPEVRAAACAEYAWNTQLPDATTQFALTSRFYEGSGRRPTTYQSESLIPRVLRRMWGEDWHFFRRLFEQNLSLPYAADPLAASNESNDGESLSDPYQHLEEEAAAFDTARRDLDAYMRRLDAEPNRAEHLFRANPLGYQSALYFYQMTHLAAAKTMIEATIKRAVYLARSGLTAPASDTLRALLQQIPDIEERLPKVNGRVLSDPRIIRRRALSPIESADGALYRFRPSEQVQRIECVLSMLLRGEVHHPLRIYLSDDIERVTEETDSPPDHSESPIALTIDWVERRDATVTYGYATLVHVAPCLHLARPNSIAGFLPSKSSDGRFTLTVSIIHDGATLAKHSTALILGTKPWRPERPIQIDLGLQVTGKLTLGLKAVSQEGIILGACQAELS